ncbi:SH3 domain-containing protein [Algoriphagus namhaensis]
MVLYQKNYQEGIYSPAMLLKMAFIAEGVKDYENASLYLGKYYDLNPDPQIISKIKSLTKQSSLEGYEVSDAERFLLFLSENDLLIILTLAALLLISLIMLLISIYRKTTAPMYWPTLLLLFLLFMANNFLGRSNSGLITHSPTLILSEPSAAGELIQRVEPGHRIKIKSSNDIWFRIEWKGEQAYVKKSNVTRL